MADPLAANDASVTREGDALVFRGVIDRAAVPGLWTRARPLLAGIRRLDLAQAGAIDSAGLALLAELASAVPGIELHGNPSGLSELRAAYRLGPSLGFDLAR